MTFVFHSQVITCEELTMTNLPAMISKALVWIPTLNVRDIALSFPLIPADTTKSAACLIVI